MLGLLMLSCRREGRHAGGAWPCATAWSPLALATGHVASMGGGDRPGAASLPDPGVACGRGGAALGRARLARAQALAKGGQRRETPGRPPPRPAAPPRGPP